MFTSSHYGPLTSIRLVLGGLIVLAVGLSVIAKRYPRIEWLQLFRLPERTLTPQQSAAIRRRTDRRIAAEVMLAGLGIPVIYIAGRVMMFDNVTVRGLVLSGLGTAVFLALGTWMFWRARDR